jgi:AcrR family transcriptional regulator
VRYTKEHKQETRERIIATAGRRLKRNGIDGSGVATLMKDAGLTNGSLYAYFPSKDRLVAAAVADQMRAQHEKIAARAAPGRAGLEQIVRWYFSPEQRDNIEDGCPNAALLDEIARSTDPTRQAYTDGVLVLIDDFAARLAPRDPSSARLQALGLLGMLAGTLQLSRALTDRQLADRLLEHSKDLLAFFRESWVGGTGIGFTDTRINLNRADLSGLPPTLVSWGTYEVLAGEDAEFAARVEDAGIDTATVVVPGGQHSYVYGAGRIPETDAAIAQIGAWVREKTKI